MSSPAVWIDARDRVLDAAAALGIPVAWPNERFKQPEPPAPFVAVEISGDTSEPIELGGNLWQETGALWLHVMVPTGEGIEQGLTIRKALANAFRGLPPASVLYRGAIMDPGGMDEDGTWFRMSLRVPYAFQDFTTPA